MSHAENPSGVSDDEALRRMHRITADYERPHERKLEELLRLGCTYLDVEAGFLTEIADGTQRIVEASGEHPLLQPGASCPLSEAYCRKTITRQDALTVQHAAIEGWETDTAYETFGLEAYIGAKVVVDGDVYGTFCFADSEPRDQPFSASEETFVELMAKWVSYELFQQHATERIQRQRDQLEEFASVVSHDLRNPLTVAKGHAEFASEEYDSDSLIMIKQSLDRIDDLITDLLTLAREGKSVGERQPVRIDELSRTCWANVETGGVELETADEFAVLADGRRLRALFENLYRNAVEHGWSTTTISVGRLADEAGFYVADDGVGIDEADRETVFEKGYSTDTTGTGFGLAIVKQVVEAHGWQIRVVESDAGGARFEITGVEVAANETPSTPSNDRRTS